METQNIRLIYFVDKTNALKPDEYLAGKLVELLKDGNKIVDIVWEPDIIYKILVNTMIYGECTFRIKDNKNES